jgi:hypothetical protein
MIQGTFGEKGQLLFEIELVTREGLSLPTEAMLDTGFTEHLRGFLEFFLMLDGIQKARQILFGFRG